MNILLQKFIIDKIAMDEKDSNSDFSEEDDESEYKQKPALPFEEVGEDHEDYEAYQYLMMVRTQANEMKEKYKPKL